jgi:hypothetical protein
MSDIGCLVGFFMEKALDKISLARYNEGYAAVSIAENEKRREKQ